MLQKLRKLFRNQSGQGMTEYVIMVSLIAVAAIGVVTVFGDNIRALFGASVDALSGQQTGEARTSGAGETDARRNIKDFAKDVKGDGRK
jgi:Flp pilus assembly pilin Flp